MQSRSRRSLGLLDNISLPFRLSPSFSVTLGPMLRSKDIAQAAMRSMNKCVLSLLFTAVTLLVFLPTTPFYRLQVCSPRGAQLEHQSRIVFCQHFKKYPHPSKATKKRPPKNPTKKPPHQIINNSHTHVQEETCEKHKKNKVRGDALRWQHLIHRSPMDLLH